VKLVLGVMVGVILAGLMTRSDVDTILRARFPLQNNFCAHTFRQQ
jgi:hypothetical protein